MPMAKTPSAKPDFSLLYWPSGFRKPSAMRNYFTISSLATLLLFQGPTATPRISEPQAATSEEKLPEAIEANQKTLLSQPRNEAVELSLAGLYRRVHNDEQARIILQTARRQHPRSLVVLRAVGMLELDTMNYAASHFRFSRRACPCSHKSGYQKFIGNRLPEKWRHSCRLK